MLSAPVSRHRQLQLTVSPPVDGRQCQLVISRTAADSRDRTKTRTLGNTVGVWLKDLAPSTELRKWFAHDPAKWQEFQARYRRELREKTETLKFLKEKSQRRTVTLLYGAKDEKHNEAMVLGSVLGRRKG